MNTLIFGSGSYLGRSLFEFLENTNITVAGTGEYITDKKIFLKPITQ